MLERALPDRDVQAYVQRLFGYSLTGSSRDHVLGFFHGSGRNGKGTLTHAIRAVLGDYAIEISPEVLVESHNDRHPTELTGFRGARLVVGSEIGSNRRWNEPLLKRLTGGDPISARYTGKDFFEFNPTHTLIIFANSKPSLRVVDEAIKARIQFVPFTEIIPEAERDTALPEKLKAEYGGILQWAIEGCLDWLQRGLDPPLTVRDASDAYLESEDHIQQWMNERCKTEGSIRLAEAYLSYKLWCNDNSAAQLGRNTFADQLAARDGVQRSQRGAKTVSFSGLSLKDFRERDIDA